MVFRPGFGWENNEDRQNLHQIKQTSGKWDGKTTFMSQKSPGRFPSGWCLFIDSGTNALLLLSSVLNNEETFFFYIWVPNLTSVQKEIFLSILGHTFKAIFKNTGWLQKPFYHQRKLKALLTTSLRASLRGRYVIQIVNSELCSPTST